MYERTNDFEQTEIILYIYISTGWTSGVMEYKWMSKHNEAF